MDKITHPTLSRECRRLIHDDMDANEVAAALYKRGVPTENVGHHIYEYLVACWDATPEWDDPDFMKIVEAVVNPTTQKVAGFEAAKIAYDQLEYSEQDLLKFNGVEGLSEEAIAQGSRTPLNQVKRDATSAKEKFWKLFTRERWSTLAYLIEKLCEDTDSSSTDILKVEAEYLAAKAAYNSLDAIEREVLRQRCVQGRSVEVIASEQQASLVEITEILASARAEFYDKFLSEMYHLSVLDKTYKTEDEEDAIGDAWKNLQERIYKFVPESYQGWLTKSAKRVRRDSEKKDNRQARIAQERGRVYVNSEGEPVRVASLTGDPLEPHEEIEKEEAEKKELRFWESEREQWHQLLTKITMAILRSKKPEKKLFLLIHYVLQPKLNELRTTKPCAIYECQYPGEAMAIAHVRDQYRSKATQAWVGEVIDATDRSIRRYVDEIIPLVKEYAEEVGISTSELVKGCAPIKE